jgi:hypothetical protein
MISKSIVRRSFRLQPIPCSSLGPESRPGIRVPRRCHGVSGEVGCRSFFRSASQGDEHPTVSPVSHSAFVLVREEKTVKEASNCSPSDPPLDRLSLGGDSFRQG